MIGFIAGIMVGAYLMAVVLYWLPKSCDQAHGISQLEYYGGVKGGPNSEDCS